MANFATEQDVRDKFQLTDTTLVPAALVDGSIDDAHVEVLRRLDPVYDVPSPEEGVVLGETLLAGAHLVRTLASRSAFESKHLSVGGRRIQPGNRVEALTGIGESAELRAWEVLEPFLLPRAGRTVAEVTTTTPVLGEEE